MLKKVCYTLLVVGSLALAAATATYYVRRGSLLNVRTPAYTWNADRTIGVSLAKDSRYKNVCHGYVRNNGTQPLTFSPFLFVKSGDEKTGLEAYTTDAFSALMSGQTIMVRDISVPAHSTTEIYLRPYGNDESLPRRFTVELFGTEFAAVM